MAVLPTVNLNQPSSYHDILINNLMPRAPRMKLAEEKVITHKGPKEYHLTEKEQDKRTLRIRSYNAGVRAKWFLYGGLFACAIIGLLSFFGV